MLPVDVAEVPSWGKKNLLGIAVKGSCKPAFADPDRIKVAIKTAMKTIRSSETADGFREHGTGTAGDMGLNDVASDWPTKYWQASS